MSDANYEAPDATGTFVIAKKATTITFGALSATYNGAPQGTTATTPELGATGISLTYDGAATAPTNAGSYAVVATLSDANHEAPDATDTFVIARLPLTITSSSPAPIVYGSPAPAITPAYVGFVSGEDPGNSLLALPNCSTDYTIGSDIGVYATHCSGASAQNYDISYNPGSFTVIRRGLTIRASSPSDIIVGAGVPTVTPIYSGFISGDDEHNALTTQPTCSTNYAVGSVGPQTTSCAGAAALNYTITYESGSFNALYLWSGFLQPINDTAHQTGVTQSKFKLGQTVPAKFVIRDATARVVQQTETPTFARSANRGTCDPSAAIETGDPLAADVSPTYKWDGTQYHYNWSTKGLTPGVYRIYATLADGTRPWVDICLTK